MDNLRKTLQPSRTDLEKRLTGHYDGPTLQPQLFWA
jgi:hypothetical protein